MSRHDRVQMAIKREVSTILHDELKDPRLGFVTIIRVELSKDMRFVRVFYGVLGNEQDCKKTKDALDSALGYIRRLVAERINLKFAPVVSFHEDHSTEYSIKIQEILNEIGVPDEPKKVSRVRKKK